VLVGVDHGLARQRHVEKLLGAADDEGAAEVDGVAEDVKETEPALDDTLVCHTFRY